MRARKGFSLVEVVVALLILTVMMLGAQALAGRMIRTSATASIQVTAAQLADDRIDYLRMDPQYDSLTARYVADENPVAGYGGYRRTTAVNRTITATTNGTTDFTTITVTVTHQQLATAVARTIVMTRL
jgi:type IV pilus modification protein PilV